VRPTRSAISLVAFISAVALAQSTPVVLNRLMVAGDNSTLQARSRYHTAIEDESRMSSRRYTNHREAIRDQSSAPTFAPTVTYNSGGDLTRSVAVGDLNGDGKADLVLTNAASGTSSSDGVVSVLLAMVTARFKPP
jgi:hypothetical protein